MLNGLLDDVPAPPSEAANFISRTPTPSLALAPTLTLTLTLALALTITLTIAQTLTRAQTPYQAANFSYYTHQLLGVSGVFPLGGPHKGGTGVTLVGGGFSALREIARDLRENARDNASQPGEIASGEIAPQSWSCKIGPVGPTPATLGADGALRCVVPPTRQPEQIFDTRLRPQPTPGEVRRAGEP